jgi:hypothetical protein
MLAVGPGCIQQTSQYHLLPLRSLVCTRTRLANSRLGVNEVVRWQCTYLLHWVHTVGASRFRCSFELQRPKKHRSAQQFLPDPHCSYHY